MSDNNIPNIPDGFIPIEPDEAMRNFQKNIDQSVIQPNFDYKKTEQDFRKQIDNLSTYQDRIEYANKVSNKGSFFRDFLIAVLGGTVVLAIEHCADIYDLIVSLIKTLR